MENVLESVVADCKAAAYHPDAQARVETILRKAVENPEVAEAAIAYRDFSSLEDLAIHRCEKLTVLVGNLPPGFRASPHNHNIWSVVGVCRGQEDNEFYERDNGGLKKVGEATVVGPDVLPNAAEVIHAIHNPLDEPLLVVHVYGGDLFTTPRSSWDPRTHTEIPFDWEKTRPA